MTCRHTSKGRPRSLAHARNLRATAKPLTSLHFTMQGMECSFEGKNFIMPIRAELQDEVSLRYELTRLDDVKAALRLSPGVKIMVLDACAMVTLRAS
jgi:hypothetical protein